MRSIVLILITLASLPSVNADSSPTPQLPNVIIFYTDDQGTLDAKSYGATDLYTPAMDSLASTGTRFTQAYAHTVCCPSRAMLLTGRYPQRSGVNEWTQNNMKGEKGVNMALSEVTLAETFKAAGYKTALFGKWHLGAHKDFGPTKQGFDEFFGHRGGFIDNYNHFFLHGMGFHDLYEGTTEVFKRDAYFPDLVTARAADYIQENKDNPFFLYLAFNIPHYPEQSDSAFDERYADLPEPRRSYAKMISTVDDRIGRILTHLDTLGLRENTIVIFMSDNGHSTEETEIRYDDHLSGLPKGHDYCAHGGGGYTGKWRGEKKSYFEGGIRVPAIISAPGRLPKGEVRDQVITAMDWYPTLLELCNITPAEELSLDGRSIVNLIRDNAAPSPHGILHWEWRDTWAILDGDWKLIGDKEQANFLSNLSDEAPEQKNYLSEKPELAQRLHQAHRDWLEETTPH